MNIHIHVSYPENLGTQDSKRVWMIPAPFRQICVEILGGDICKPSSIPLRKGYFTQSQTTVEIQTFLKNTGRKYREISASDTINYEQVLQEGYEYIFQKNNGGWAFSSIFDMISQGYTGEAVDAYGEIISVGETRKFSLKRSDGGVRYILQYDNLEDHQRDIQNIEQMKLSEEENKKKYHSLDDLYELIF